MSVNIDAREVLDHLNLLGYRNITPEQLKEFIKDLKKLIKYETQPEIYKRNLENDINRIFNKHELLYMKPTESSKLKRNHSTPPAAIDTRSTSTRICLSRETCTKPLEEADESFKTVRSSKTKSDKDNTILKEIDPNTHVSRPKNKAEKDKMWIRPKSNSRQKCWKKSDPVALYQNYQMEWNRFKEQIPIDNKHLDLRWSVRQKTIG